MSDETAPTPQVRISWIFWTLLAFTIFAIIAAYSSRMTNDYTDYDQKRAAERQTTLDKLRAEEHQTLTTADWVDQSKGTVRIPIDEAMAHEIANLKNKPVGSGNLIATPAAPAAATPAPASTNAAPAAATTNAAPAAATNAAPATPPPAKEKK